MNRLKATNSVAFSSRDTAPASGTPQYATDGNPGGGIPATNFPAYAWNMVQDELMAVITDAGVTPDDTNWSQVLSALSLKYANHGQCRLSVVSTSSLKLSPYNGNIIRIAGASYQIPSSGITISNTGLVASTLYYAYVFNNSGTLTLELSTTWHATDTTAGNVGVEIKSGDPTRTLVGMIYTSGNTPGQFLDAYGTRWCVNWFNRRLLSSGSVGAQTGSTTSLTPVEINTLARGYWLAWPDESLEVTVIGYVSNSGAGNDVLTQAMMDGTGLNQLVAQTSAGAGYKMNCSQATSLGATVMTEGNHYCGVLGEVSAGTGSWSGLGVTVLFRG